MSGKRVLVIGSGGREHALAWALARSPKVEQVYIAPGNAGTVWSAPPHPTALQPCAPAARVPIAADDIPALIAFARRADVDLTVVGPEDPLAAGIVDMFQAAGLHIFGSTLRTTRLEASKAFAREFMHQHHIPTAAYAVFDSYAAACRHLRRVEHPVVIKADGLTGGRGVFLCHDADRAQAVLHRMMVEGQFGPAGRRVVIEECLTGLEISIAAFSDGRTVVPMLATKDYLRLHDGERGPVTGGMGAFAPVPDVTPALMERVMETVLQPAVRGMAERDTPYTGILYAGLMLTRSGPRVIEFNCRFGDPEAQAILPLLQTDLFDILTACLHGELHRVPVRWRSGACAAIVLAAPGYPARYRAGLTIEGLAEAAAMPDVLLFHGGTTRHADRFVVGRGRVLTVAGLGNTLPAALERAYRAAGRIRLEGVHYRRDIGQIYAPA
ncbi:MAG: phosphoribosylamine--glycine ligase [Caldilineae bacterium]|nr:MAG: phosphoribosylamine--glycine ligase [Caldilineae bacterium]